MVARLTPSHVMATSTKQISSTLIANHCEFLEVDELEFDTSGLHTRLLSPTAKQRLLSQRHSQPSQQAHDDPAVTLLADLHDLAPSVAKDFCPKIATQDNFDFRLINDVYFDGEEKSYIAISYVWHKNSRDNPRKLISPVGDLPFGWVRTVEQFPLPVMKGMFQTMLNERRINEGLWFDQVCIDQEDENEKTAAIAHMDAIYRNARIVVAALDDVTAPLDEMEFLEKYHQRYASTKVPVNQHPHCGLNPPIMEQFPLLRHFVERVLNSMWFERAWCAHEMRMGRNHVFLVPCEAEDEEESVYTIIRFTDTFLIHMLMLAREVISTPATQQRIRSLLQQFAISPLPPEPVQSPVHDSYHISIPSTPRPLIPTIAEIFSLKAGGNPRLPSHLRALSANRDKTSIALNLSAIPLALRAPSPLQRPSLEHECFRALLLLSLASRDPLSLCTTGIPLRLHDGSTSWLCAPTALDLPPSYSTAPPSFPPPPNSLTQTSDGLAEALQLDLVFLDLPHHTRPSPTFAAHVQRARETVDLCIRCRVQSHPLWNLWQTGAPGHMRAPAMRNIFVQTLACFFECGAAWLVDAVSQPYFPRGGGGVVLEPRALDALFDVRVPLQAVAQEGLLAEVLDVVGRMVAHGLPWASGASETSHGPLIVSAPASASPSTYPPLPRGKALIFAPFAHSKALLVAIPAVVKDSVYAGLARGWVITSSNPYTGGGSTTVSWVLRGKGVLFGEGRFIAELGKGATAAVRNHRVFGPGVGDG